MNGSLAAFVYRTRGLYMFIALAVSIVVKFYLGGTTSLPAFVTGLLIMVMIQALKVYAASYLWGRQAVAKPEADFLCTVGPYKYVRNPLYLGNLLIGMGMCIAINEWYAYALFVVSYAIVYSIVIPYEERFLHDRFGDVYAEYEARTGRLIPRLKGYQGGRKVIPNYRAGILGEIHVPIFLAVISLTIFLSFVREV